MIRHYLYVNEEGTEFWSSFQAAEAGEGGGS